MSADHEYRARFSREADLASTLCHPHIVSVHDRGEYKGQQRISMDYVDGLDAGRLPSSRFRADGAGMTTGDLAVVGAGATGAPTACGRRPVSGRCFRRHIAHAGIVCGRVGCWSAGPSPAAVWPGLGRTRAVCEVAGIRHRRG